MKEFFIFLGIIITVVAIIVTPIVLMFVKQAEKIKEKIRVKREKEAEESWRCTYECACRANSGELSDEEIDKRLEEIETKSKEVEGSDGYLLIEKRVRTVSNKS